MEPLFAVAGNPILGSKSPGIMNAALVALSLPGVYTRLAASRAGDIIGTAESLGIKGLNVTAPFKEAIIPYLDDLDEHARTIGSVNTVVREDGRFKGCNTDFIGVSRALTGSGVDPRGKKAVVLGAGGAGRAAVSALLASGARVTLINRTGSKAARLAGDMGCSSLPFARIDEAVEEADILISCIPSCDRIIAPSSLKKGMVILDGQYSSESALVRDGRARGARIIDGREWLLFQALPAFRLFTGRDAPVEAMRKALYAADRPVKANVGLIGFMGAGKSVVGRETARRMDMAALDTDRAIINRAGLSISEIFERRGEEGFRILEKEEVSRVRDISRAVISFGGGTVLSAANAGIIRQRCVSVWLWASPGAIIRRIGAGSKRPLLKGKVRKEDIEAMLEVRLPFYARVADCIIDTDRSNSEEVMERICYEISASF